VSLIINVQIPYMPITSTGKEPDLGLFFNDITDTVEAAAKKCQRADQATMDQDGVLPRRGKGKQSEEKRTAYKEKVDAFVALLLKIDSRLDFKVSSRGWCYILENEHGLPKGDFKAARELITKCRKNGRLPIDFVAEDEDSDDDPEDLDDPDPAVHAAALAAHLHEWSEYTPVSFWDFQPVYIEMLVEKSDLKNLFLPICEQYYILPRNTHGWSSLHKRSGLLRRFKKHLDAGRKCVLLYCGDHDPSGLQISDRLMKNLQDLKIPAGWRPDETTLIIDRFGLNTDFIDKNHLTWIDGLETGSGMDLGDSEHKMHNRQFVQDYIDKYGERKVEANALVVRPDEGRQLCRDAIKKYLDPKGIVAYEQALAEQRALCKAALPAEVKQVLEEIERGGRQTKPRGRKA
jgi:hypothetical protein